MNDNCFFTLEHSLKKGFIEMLYFWIAGKPILVLKLIINLSGKSNFPHIGFPLYYFVKEIL